MTQRTVNFEKLSDMGLIWKINKEILHPLGLALCRDGSVSPGALVSDDGKWEYPPETDIRNSAKYNTTVEKHKSGVLIKELIKQIKI